MPNCFFLLFRDTQIFFFNDKGDFRFFFLIRIAIHHMILSAALLDVFPSNIISPSHPIFSSLHPSLITPVSREASFPCPKVFINNISLLLASRKSDFSLSWNILEFSRVTAGLKEVPKGLLCYGLISVPFTETEVAFMFTYTCLRPFTSVNLQ